MICDFFSRITFPWSCSCWIWSWLTCDSWLPITLLRNCLCWIWSCVTFESGFWMALSIRSSGFICFLLTYDPWFRITSLIAWDDWYWSFHFSNSWYLSPQLEKLWLGNWSWNYVNINRPSIPIIRALHVCHFFSNWHQTDRASHLPIFAVIWGVCPTRCRRLLWRRHKQLIMGSCQLWRWRRHALIRRRVWWRHVGLRLPLRSCVHAASLSLRGCTPHWLVKWG